MRLLVAVLFAISFASLAHAQRYQYVNPVNPRHNWVIELEPAQFIFSGRAVGAEFCVPATKFVCVKSDNFNFAFPLNRAPEQKQWTLHGFTYQLEGRAELLILGQLLPVWMIESVQGEVTPNHRGIYNRENYERSRIPKSRLPSPIWGTPNPTPVDTKGLYDQYRKKTTGCCG